MVKNYLLLLALCFFSSINAQIINIPDANFKAKLLEADASNEIAKDINQKNIKIDINGDGEIQLSEGLNVYFLDLRESNISSLVGIKSFSNLSQLDCYSNNLINLNVSEMSGLNILRCSKNQISNLNVLGLINLVEFDCSDNQLMSLDLKGLNVLQSLMCADNPLTKLEFTATSTLLAIDCSNAKLTNLDVKNSTNLIGLYCSNNELSSLDLKGMVNLEQIFCSSNKLTNLDLTDQINLSWILCMNNLLTNIKLPKKVDVVNLDTNPLTNLDLTNSNIKFIVISNTLLKSIDLSSSPSKFFIDNNPFLESLFIKNGDITVRDGNSSIWGNQNLKYICADEEEISLIEQLMDEEDLKCIINSYCSFISGGENFTITGKSIVDANNNGCDILDNLAPNIKFTVNDGVKSGSIIDDSGNYSLKLPAGNYTITPTIEKSAYFSISPTFVKVELPNTVNPYVQNFCITPLGIHKDLEVTIIPIQNAIPGFDTQYKLVYKNKGNSIESGTLNLIFNDAVLDLISSNPVISSQSLNSLSWEFIDLKPFETREISFVFNLNSPTETPAVNISDILKYKASVNFSGTDETPVDNTFSLNQIVVGSYDPNDKTCLEGDVITPSLIGEYVHYLIRFENTGTYPAENIVVKDMIDLSKFDIATLVPTSSSHSYTTKISDGNKVEFIFEKIKLPYDDAHNDGYIAFKIKTLPTLSVGNSFTNEANIYFDYNFPILTNKATSTFKTLGTKDFDFSNYFNIYPNPAKDVLNISLKNNIEINSMSIYDVLGQLIIAVPNGKIVSTIDVSRLRAGNYLLKIKTDKGSSVAKFIKE